jgi:hypothetical protein
LNQNYNNGLLFQNFTKQQQRTDQDKIVGSITIKICKIQANLILSGKKTDLTLPLSVKVNVHSFNLGEIQSALQDIRVEGLTSRYEFFTYKGVLDVNRVPDLFNRKKGYYRNSSILELLSNAEEIQWYRNQRTLITPNTIQQVNLNDGEEIIAVLVLDQHSEGSFAIQFGC